MKSWTTGQMLAAIAGGVMITGVIGFAVTREPLGADITLPDSSLYPLAVTELVKRQKKEEEPFPAAQPCPDCGRIHAAPEPASPAHARPAAAVSTNYVCGANYRTDHPVVPPVQLGIAADLRNRE